MGKTAQSETPKLDTPLYRRMVEARKSPEGPKWRRRFARVAGAAALTLFLAVLAACASTTPEPTPTPTPTPETTLTLTPASLTLEQAARFLAGGEMMTEENLQEQFAGRVFKDEKTGATIVLSKAAKDALLSQIPADKLPGMSVEEINQELAKLMEGSEWMKVLELLQDYNNVKTGKISSSDYLKINPENLLLVDGRYVFLFPQPLSPRQWPKLIDTSAKRVI